MNAVLQIPGERVDVREPRIRLVPLAQIRLRTARRYLVKGLFPREGLTLVWGPPKSGKSFWMSSVAMHVALGWDYRGRRVQQGAVVYCAFEGQSGFEARVEAFRLRFLTEEHEPVPFYLQPATLDLVKDAGELIAAIRLNLSDTPPVLVVLDTLNRSLSGSESSDEDMAAYVRAADSIREAFACSVVVVHHCGHDHSRPRGHTSLTGAADAQLSVKRAAGDVVMVEVELAKDGPQGDVIASRLESVEVGFDEDGDVITSCVVVPVEGDAVPSSKPMRRLSDGAHNALRAFEEAIAELGEGAPNSNHIPRDATVVTLTAWRRYAYARGISTSDEERAKQQAFKRATEALIAAGRVAVWEQYAWRVA
ncbi:AAA family ATPase [Pseudoxanthobacter sp. M-2]|uniref:AAA family ATPase n=1 Tax=Pseudoxanthobacter sp. M-2 TaxID=3078754 RepID=UPI0038FCAD6B